MLGREGWIDCVDWSELDWKSWIRVSWMAGYLMCVKTLEFEHSSSKGACIKQTTWGVEPWRARLERTEKAVVLQRDHLFHLTKRQRVRVNLVER